MSGFGFRVEFRVAGFGFRVSGFGVQVSGFGFRVSGFVFRVSDVGAGQIHDSDSLDQSLGFRVAGF